MEQLIIGKNEAGQRLDKFLIKYFHQAPKSFIYKMLRKKNIILNDKKAEGSEKLKIEDRIKFYLSEETIQRFSKVCIEQVKPEIEVIFENNDILIANKPAGMLSQKAKKEDISFIEHLISYLLVTNQISEEELKKFRPGICNRLDRNTSGLLICGKTLLGLQKMGALIKERKMEKYYLCIVKGQILQSQQIESYLLKDESHNRVTITEREQQGASYIKTEYEPLESNTKYTLLKVKLITGRSHQIRAHLKSIGHPIIGDGKYGDVQINKELRKKYLLKNQLLHAAEIKFPYIEEGELTFFSERSFKAPLPEQFCKLKKQLLG